ncbi:hypothetical protein ACFZB9_22980 [Kitasatospora sp. NPDC008050]|uniref:hypothetical protein n=1 Tax=Kitasatospora sp. NPDC008050 TaxID=3364021 RepID=UPI0036EDB766
MRKLPAVDWANGHPRFKGGTPALGADIHGEPGPVGTWSDEPDQAVVLGRKSWNVDRLGLPNEDVELRVFSNGHYYGRFLLQPTPSVAPSLEARLVAVTLADQAGNALDTLQSPALTD